MGERDEERTAVPRLLKADTHYFWKFDICALDSYLHTVYIVNKNTTISDSQKCQDGKLLVFLKH